MDISIKTHINARDVIEAGACTDGVFDWLIKHGIKRPLLSVKAALKLCSEDEQEYIFSAAGLNGNGNGYGYGYGNP